jgi:hypothetical protein
MVVREHKPIFVAACNMANLSDRISFYGEECLDEFLKVVLQDKSTRRRLSSHTMLEGMTANL